MTDPRIFQDKETILSFLKKLEIFQSMGNGFFEELIEGLELINLYGQQTLITQGEIGDAMYIVLHGRLRAYKTLEKKEEIVGEIGATDVVGEIALIITQPRSATVRAIRNSVLLRLTKENFEKIIIKYPEAAFQISRLCIKRLIDYQAKSGKIGGDIVTITLVPLAENPENEFLIKYLVAALTHFGPVFHVNEEVALKELKSKVLDKERIISWLNDIEFKYRFIIYEANPILNDWSKICIQQADRICLLTKFDNPDKSKTQLEKFIYDQKNNTTRISLALLHNEDDPSPVNTKDWLTDRGINDHFHIKYTVAQHIERLARIISGHSLGLVLSGGGARGLAHIGLIRALEEKKIPIDMIGGTSSGALISAAYAMGFGSEAMIEQCRKLLLSTSKLDLTLPIISLSTAQNLVNGLVDAFGENRNIEDLWLSMFCMATNLSKSEPRRFDSGSVWRSIRASLSLPGIYPPVLTKEGLLVDGAVLNNMPVEVMYEKLATGKVMAALIEVSSETMETEHESVTLSGWNVLWRRINPMLKKYNVPRIDTILMRTISIHELKHQQQQVNRADYKLILNLNDYGLMSFKSFDRIIEEGYQQAMEQLDKISFKS